MNRVHMLCWAILPWLCHGLAARADAPQLTSPDLAQLRWVLPIHSTRLSPGPVARRALAMPAMPPLFLVGQDPLSLHWLTVHAPTLQAQGVSGLAVEVADSAALQRIQAAAPALAIWPVSGDDLAGRLQLEHYPVLITPTALEQ